MTIKEKMYDNIAVITLKGNLMGDPDSAKLRDKVYSLLQEDFKKIIIDNSGNPEVSKDTINVFSMIVRFDIILPSIKYISGKFVIFQIPMRLPERCEITLSPSLLPLILNALLQDEITARNFSVLSNTKNRSTPRILYFVSQVTGCPAASIAFK